MSQSKLRPAVVLADCERNDWLLCQITSNPYADSRAVQLEKHDFSSGMLRTTSFARPTKLFTAHQSLIVPSAIGLLNDASFRRITDALIQLLRPKS
ncbi:MAG: type II toxin-antitoxin system PemK/MazF family toxin [Limisphaerales bacterium]